MAPGAPAEERHLETRLRFQTLCSSIGDGFCIIDVLFDAEGAAVDYRFLETNPEFLRQTGLPDVIGRCMRELAPDHEPFWYETYGRIATSGQPIRFEHRARALGRWYDVYAFPISQNPSAQTRGVVH